MMHGDPTGVRGLVSTARGNEVGTGGTLESQFELRDPSRGQKGWQPSIANVRGLAAWMTVGVILDRRPLGGETGGKTTASLSGVRRFTRKGRSTSDSPWSMAILGIPMDLASV